jgi:hypothetical protein
MSPGSPGYAEAKWVAQMYAYNHMLDQTSAEPLANWVANPTAADLTNSGITDPMATLAHEETTLVADTKAEQDAQKALTADQTADAGDTAKIQAAKTTLANATATANQAQQQVTAQKASLAGQIAKYNTQVTANNVDIVNYNNQLHKYLTWNIENSPSSQYSLLMAMEKKGNITGLAQAAGFTGDIAAQYAGEKDQLQQYMTSGGQLTSTAPVDQPTSHSS